MSRQVIENSWTPDRYDQLQIWDRLPLTPDQRVTVLKAMRAAALSEANSGSDSTGDQKEEPCVSETEAKTEKTSDHN